MSDLIKLSLTTVNAPDAIALARFYAKITGGVAKVSGGLADVGVSAFGAVTLVFSVTFLTLFGLVDEPRVDRPPQARLYDPARAPGGRDVTPHLRRDERDEQSEHDTERRQQPGRDAFERAGAFSRRE